MNASGAWQPLPLMIAAAEPNGPVEQPVFDAMIATWRGGLEAVKGRWTASIAASCTAPACDRRP
jgi:hypothetical protein